MQVTPAAREDLAAVLAMMERCSPRTLFHRFHGVSDGRPHMTALLQHPPGDEVLAAWDGSACVGLAMLGRDAAGTVHLGVLVEDAWQRHGVGARLVADLLRRARRNGVRRVHADVLGEDAFIVTALRRVGPLSVSIESGTLSVEIDLGVR